MSKSDFLRIVCAEGEGQKIEFKAKIVAMSSRLIFRRVQINHTDAKTVFSCAAGGLPTSVVQYFERRLKFCGPPTGFI